MHRELQMRPGNQFGGMPCAHIPTLARILAFTQSVCPARTMILEYKLCGTYAWIKYRVLRVMCILLNRAVLTHAYVLF